MSEESELEKEIDHIVEKYWIENFECSKTRKYNLKLAILEAYTAGLEMGRQIFR